MNNQHFYDDIAKSSASRQSRNANASYVSSHPEAFTDLFEIAIDITNENHHKACWILELVLEENINLLSPHLGRFCAAIALFSHDGAVRSISKICMFLSKKHFNEVKAGGRFLTEKQFQMITEACFDWLITDSKVAAKAYAMRTLFETGKLQDWIYPQLAGILEKDFAYHSVAYQAAAKELLMKMRKIKIIS